MQNNIGDARREYAAKYGKFTQEDAAVYFGVSTSTYKKWEQGQGMLNGEQLRALAQKYETTVDYLLDRSVNYAIVELPEEQWTTADERKLLSYYRGLSDELKKALLEMASTLASVKEGGEDEG